MFNGHLNVENLREIIIVEQTKELLRQHCHHGWDGLISYICTPRNKPKNDKWNFFVKSLNYQKLYKNWFLFNFMEELRCGH